MVWFKSKHIRLLHDDDEYSPVSYPTAEALRQSMLWLRQALRRICTVGRCRDMDNAYLSHFNPEAIVSKSTITITRKNTGTKNSK